VSPIAKKQSGNSSNFEGFEFKLNLSPQNIIVYSLPLIYLAWIIYSDQGGVTEISWNEFRNHFLEKGLVEKLVVVNRSIVRVFLKGDSGNLLIFHYG
jgi:AFG3 family protein